MPSQFIKLPRNEKAFIIASIQLTAEKEKQETEKLKWKKEVENPWKMLYTYTGYAIVDDSTVGFTYANISQVDPLETKGMRYLIDCPEEVEQTANPLFLIFTLDQKDYKLVIR